MSSVITRQQALARGTTPGQLRHLLARGTWQRVFPGVYVQHTGTLTYRERLEAATLARGDGARVSLECALHLWGLTDREPPIITLAEPAATHRTGELPGVRVRRRRRLSVGKRHGIRVTGLPQTILDLAAQPDRGGDDTVALVTRAVAARKITVDDLRAELTHHPLHPARALLEEVLGVAAEGLESAAEARYADSVERAHGLPAMERQSPVDGPSAVRDGRTRRFDFRDGARGVVVEVDGELYHRDRAAQDRARDREAAGRGDVVLRVGWFEVVDAPCQVASDVAATLVQRGWHGRPLPCSPGCPVATDPRLRAPA